MIKLVYIESVKPAYQGGLTLNKVYCGKLAAETVLDPDFYYIDKNDDGVGHYYHRFLFKKLDEIRDGKLNSLLL